MLPGRQGYSAAFFASSNVIGHGLMSLALQVAEAINFFAMNGHIHGDVSAHNISYQGGKATLIDLATLRPIDQVSAGLSLWQSVASRLVIVAICRQQALTIYVFLLSYISCVTQVRLQASEVTGTPAFLSLAVLSGQPQTESTELESLLYSMLYAATKGKLHWGAYLDTDSAARDAKLAAMVVDDEFESVVVSRIDDSLLRCVARCVRALFFVNGKRLRGVQSKNFVAAIGQGQDAYVALEAGCAV